jgi:hypothetical protein
MDKKFKSKSTVDPRKGKKDPLADYKAQERRKKKIKEQGSFKMGGKIMKANTGRMALDPTKPQPQKRRSLREKIDLEKFKKERRKKKKPAIPLGGMKKPKPGTYDYQLQETLKPNYRIKGMRTGGICRGMGAALRGGDFKGVK